MPTQSSRGGAPTSGAPPKPLRVSPRAACPACASESGPARTWPLQRTASSEVTRQRRYVNGPAVAPSAPRRGSGRGRLPACRVAEHAAPWRRHARLSLEPRPRVGLVSSAPTHQWQDPKRAHLTSLRPARSAPASVSTLRREEPARDNARRAAGESSCDRLAAGVEGGHRGCHRARVRICPDAVARAGVDAGRDDSGTSDGGRS